MTTILVVDDEQNIVQLARLYLEREGYKVESAATGQEAVEKVKVLHPSLVVLDVMLPGLDGFEVCRQLRRLGDVPIIMLTARNEDTDKIVGLELGADDYLTKPFNPRELSARVKAILRRYEAGQQPQKTIKLGEVRLDIERREADVAGKPVVLRTKEFDLLWTLMQNHGVVLSRERLLELVWGYDFYGESRTVDVHIAHLREKLAGGELSIEAVRGIGYKLVEGN